MANAALDERTGTEMATSAKWVQPLLGFIVMMTISRPQYVCTLFTGPLRKTTGALLSDVQWTITILIVLQTWLAPLQGWLVGRFGQKPEIREPGKTARAP